ncbi:MAG: hypothetical protein AAF583_14655 [Pseudomonadota bacterium]
MESTASAWPFIVFAGLIGLGVIVGGLFGPQSWWTELDFSLLTKTTGVLPSATLRWLAFGLVSLILVASVAFWIVVKQMTDDHKTRVINAKANALPTAMEPNNSPIAKLACAIEHFQNDGFTERTRFQSIEGEELILMSKFEKDKNQIWRAEGALLSKEANSTRFSVAVVYGDGVWVEGSSKKIRRRGLRRAVHIETVLNDSDLKELSDTNDYLLTIGLASNSEDEDNNQNWRLSLARSHNIGLAALRLGWKPSDRIWPQTIGYSKTLATNDDEERKQRPVILIGVIANRSVSVPDVTKGTMEIVPLDLVDLNDYNMSISEPREPRRISDAANYLDESDMKPKGKEYEVRVLSAVSSASETDLDCSSD